MYSHYPSFPTAQYSPCMSCCAPAICLSVRNILITSPALLSYLALCGAVVNTFACRAHKVCHPPTTFTESIHQPVLALDSLILKLSNHRIRAVDGVTSFRGGPVEIHARDLIGIVWHIIHVSVWFGWMLGHLDVSMRHIQLVRIVLFKYFIPHDIFSVHRVVLGVFQARDNIQASSAIISVIFCLHAFLLYVKEILIIFDVWYRVVSGWFLFLFSSTLWGIVMVLGVPHVLV